MVDFLDELGLTDDTNYGSRPGRSTLSQLLEQYDWTLEALLQGSNVDLLYLDFEKAFDKVDFGKLLAKLKNLGIVGKIGAWLGSFMMGRQHAVKVGDKISAWIDVTSGIPQGSVIGPLLFLIMIGDLGEDVGAGDAKILKYVDDTKGMKGVRTPEDMKDFQDVIFKFTNWQVQNNMKFNSAKFQLLRLGNNLDLKESTSLYIDSPTDPLVPVNEVRDLGVIVDKMASFKAQRINATSKAQKKAAWVL